MAPYLSTKAIPASERLIFALDVPSTDDAIRLVATLDEAVSFYKLGLELFMAGGYFELIDRLADLGKKVMVDLRFFDVPETVRLAVRQLARRRPAFATVHGNDAILAAAAGEKGPVQILAVTALTSLTPVGSLSPLSWWDSKSFSQEGGRGDVRCSPR
ncbi:MAG: orotidine 5'-phosphate decarboxylase [Gammaproteobacteria bacterium]|nr:orotidine 5'-phosphate decarboxylase [Gammaproteobacteria bacterium]